MHLENLQGLVKELEDYSWFPSVLRNFQTEFIGFVVSRFNVYDAFIKHLNDLSLTEQSMTDLCSGSGEPAITIFRKSNCFSRLSLSDKYPGDLKTTDATITYEMKSTDVLDMEFKEGTCYTMFNAFHHFTDEEKVSIVQKIRHSGSDAFIVEILQPNFMVLMKVLFATTIGSLVLTPFITPFSLKRLFFTYIFPINILAITYDGIVSVFKSRTVRQYQDLLAETGKPIHVFRLKSNLSTLVVIHIEQPK